MKNVEIWRPIAGYEGLYEVSSYGRVKCLDRFFHGHEKSGYLYVSLSGNETLLHRVVAKAFPEICGEMFEGCHVHHKNFNKLDNRPENLIVLSSSEHSKLHYKTQSDSFKKPSKKRNESISKALSGRRAEYKHTPIIQLTKNGEIVKKWDCISDVQKELGYSAGNICWVCKGKWKTAYGFLWQYAVND